MQRGSGVGDGRVRGEGTGCVSIRMGVVEGSRGSKDLRSVPSPSSYLLLESNDYETARAQKHKASQQ